MMIWYAIIFSVLSSPVIARVMECTDHQGYWDGDTITITDKGPGRVAIDGTHPNLGDLILIHAKSYQTITFSDQHTTLLTYLTTDQGDIFVAASWLVDWQESTLSHTAFDDRAQWYLNADYTCTIKAQS
ncbi:MAG: hypothetical protein AAF701_05480 [Pseudomonadota bacterium]